MGIHGNPYFEFLVQLRREETEVAPRRLPDVQHYMSHNNFKEHITKRFSEEYPDEPKAHQLSARYKLAGVMLKEEPEEVKACIKQECDEAHAEDLQKYRENEEGVPDADPGVQRE